MNVNVPWKFDGNDWFLVISMGVLLLVILMLPKRFPAALWIPLVMYSGLLAQTSDMVLAGVYDVYDFLDSQALEPTYAVAQFVLYPEMALLYCYFYEKWHVRGWKLGLYILVWVGFSTWYEWLSVQFHVLHYKGWILLYSVPVYLLVFLSLIFMYNWVSRLYEKRDMPPG
ncbi:hypothetical protein JJB07_06505 [Tumebacillus sp. ITR2]|uniref:Uncharacterized protein n=1 Tax=Tumebacillus amylolyticus TaxID=2801339 RepID=A0ABS1J7Q7_9BACL|nr:hypothetical protein [Tumebacillus amylolyticus]MBL0386304.1 hypothetical protein [Tumebacillus amylolyticus]